MGQAAVCGAGRQETPRRTTRSGRGLLLLTPRTRELAARTTGRVDVVPVTNTEPQLIRPDGVAAWASGDRGSLDTALDTWFGHRTAPDR